MKKTLFVKPAEGGEDAELFARDLVDAVIKTATTLGWVST